MTLRERRPPSHPVFSVAPMMGWTDRHCRAFHRMLTRKALLYSEMITARAIIHGNRRQLLAFDPADSPVALQLGGAEPSLLAEAAHIGQDYGYAAINLNCGCPSPRVRDGHFGARLMTDPNRAAHCIAAIKKAVTLPVSIKCRIGVDDQGSDALDRFMETTAAAGCRIFIVHARKAWLKGLSPKDNRERPPLDYPRVHALKRRFPQLTIILNGGLADPAQTLKQLENVDGVMIGRAAYRMPWLLADVDRLFFAADNPLSDREAAMRAVGAYARLLNDRSEPISRLLRHVLGLYHGRPHARIWRRFLSEAMRRNDIEPDIITRAQAIVA